MSELIRPPIAWRRLGLICAAFALLELVTSDWYGYHRDELYFIAIGGHPAFGYVDEPPLVPLLAHGMDAASGHSLVWLRVPAALAGALAVLVTGLIAREFGGGAAEQPLAAGAMAASGLTLGTSHLMSTTTFDLLAWTVLLWLVVRALRDGGPIWLLVGLVAGVALEIKTLPIFLLFALLVAVLLIGPRDTLTSSWLWIGALIAAALWAPNLIWQATHDWPQFELAKSVAAGNSGSSEPRSLFIPFQFLLMGPPLAPIWLAGLWRLTRDRALALWRCLPLAYGILIGIFLGTGGKPYYLAGMYPVLFAAGAGPTLNWARTAARRVVLITVVAVSAVISAVVALPIVPASTLHDTPIVAMNYDAGEQVGWPAFARTIADVYASLPAPDRARTIVLTGNYGEAGAVLHFAPHVRPVYSGHNSFWDLGPPPESANAAVAIGYDESDLRDWFASVEPVVTIHNGDQLDNDEQGETVWLCRDPTASWRTLWPDMRNLG
ncbi:MAG TPA: glycosyltransferase family 39 protein [Jatrophihabitans sp.]|nr:glycosyltransferase family 39 protein [Jatrophihabitans sp.]